MSKRSKEEKAALKARAVEYVHQRSPYTQFLRDERRNHGAFAALMAQPVQAAAVYAGYLAARGELEHAFPGFRSWTPQERVARVVDNLAYHYNEGVLGGLLPAIVQEMRAEPERFGYEDRAAFERTFASAPEGIQHLAAEAEKLEMAEQLALRAVERDVEAGRTPRVLLEGDALAEQVAKMEADPAYQLRSAVATAWSQHEAEAKRHAPRVDGFTDAEYRENILAGLRDGSLDMAQAVELSEMLDAEAAKRGELRARVPRSQKEVELHDAYRLAEVRAALEAGELPPPATEYLSRPNGAPLLRGRPGSSPGAQAPLDPQTAARVAMRGMSLREALGSAYETLTFEQTGRYSPDVTGQPSAEDVAHDQRVAERIDRGEESLRDVVEAATDLAGDSREVGRDTPHNYIGAGGESLRETIERAFTIEENQE